MAGIGKALGGRARKSETKNTNEASNEATASAVTQKKTSRAEQIQKGAINTHNQWLSSEGNERGPKKEVYTEEDIPLGSILLDKKNHRTKHINVAKPTENLLSKDHPDYEKNQELIENLKEFAEHLKQEPLRQQPGVYRDSGKVYMAYGHRRFLALLIAYGPNFVYRFKVYPKRPDDLSKARFQENVQRVDVPLSDKILDFKDAQAEAIEILKKENESIGVRSVASRLGISKTQYSILDRVLKKGFLEKLIANGQISDYSRLESVISLDSEEEVLAKLGSEKSPKSKKPKERRGRPKKYIQFPRITNTELMRTIINGGLSEFDWKEEDFESYDALTEKLTECIELLASKS